MGIGAVRSEREGKTNRKRPPRGRADPILSAPKSAIRDGKHDADVQEGADPQLEDHPTLRCFQSATARPLFHRRSFSTPRFGPVEAFWSFLGDAAPGAYAGKT